MRLDKFLKVSRLIKRRTVANEAVIEIQFGTRTVKAEVLKLQDTTKKEEASELFRYL